MLVLECFNSESVCTSLQIHGFGEADCRRNCFRNWLPFQGPGLASDHSRSRESFMPTLSPLGAQILALSGSNLCRHPAVPGGTSLSPPRGQGVGQSPVGTEHRIASDLVSLPGGAVEPEAWRAAAGKRMWRCFSSDSHREDLKQMPQLVLKPPPSSNLCNTAFLPRFSLPWSWSPAYTASVGAKKGALGCRVSLML